MAPSGIPTHGRKNRKTIPITMSASAAPITVRSFPTADAVKPS
jgi:hypothetical protein